MNFGNSGKTPEPGVSTFPKPSRRASMLQTKVGLKSAPHSTLKCSRALVNNYVTLLPAQADCQSQAASNGAPQRSFEDGLVRRRRGSTFHSTLMNLQDLVFGQQVPFCLGAPVHQPVSIMLFVTQKKVMADLVLKVMLRTAGRRF